MSRVVSAVMVLLGVLPAKAFTARSAEGSSSDREPSLTELEDAIDTLVAQAKSKGASRFAVTVTQGNATDWRITVEQMPRPAPYPAPDGRDGSGAATDSGSGDGRGSAGENGREGL